MGRNVRVLPTDEKFYGQVLYELYQEAQLELNSTETEDWDELEQEDKDAWTRAAVLFKQS